MGMNDSGNVGIGKPVTGGAIYYATYGVDVPENATDPLSDDFTCVGYVSEDGVSETTETDTEEIVAWGGDTVASPQTTYTKSYTFALIETSTDSLKLVWGDDNVTEDDNGNPIVDHTTTPRGYVSLIIEMNLMNGSIRRTVVPRAQVTEVGDISYTDGEAVAYELTVTAFPVDSAVAHDYYYKESEDEVQPEKASVKTTKATAKADD